MTLRAQCELALADPAGVAARLAGHYREHGTVDREGPGERIRILYGEALVTAAKSGLRVEVEAADDTGLAYMKMGLVHHLRAFSGKALADLAWRGDGAVGVPPPFFREMRVAEAMDLTPAMRRLVLHGENLRRFAAGGLHMRLVFPPRGRELVAPIMGADGCPHWPEGKDATISRPYTIRSIDADRGTLTVDMLRHDGDATPGSRFAAHARPGDRVGMTGPGGGAAPVARRLFLFGDETAIPAIARILEGLPHGATARAVIEVAGPAEKQPLAQGPNIEIEWLHRGSGRTLADIAATLTHKSLGEDGFVWAGCEFADFKAIRCHCRAVLKLPRECHMVMAYWRRGAAGDEARVSAG